MREERIEQFAIVEADTAEELTERLNAKLKELRYMRDVKTRFDGKIAYISYIESTNVPEDMDDEFRMNGCKCYCKDCPFLEVGTDARRKWFPCQYANGGETKSDSPACEVFYREAVKKMREAAGR